jgi:single-strand DNA-binding protein
MNNWTLIGRMTKEPEISVTTNGKALCKFPLAVNRQFNRDETDFFDCIAWGKTAEIIADHHDKGSQIAVVGRAQQERWEKDGQKRSKIVMVVDSFDFVGSKKDSVTTDSDEVGF